MPSEFSGSLFHASTRSPPARVSATHLLCFCATLAQATLAPTRSKFVNPANRVKLGSFHPGSPKQPVHLSTRTSRLDLVPPHFSNRPKLVNPNQRVSPSSLNYKSDHIQWSMGFGLIKPAQFSLFYMAPVSSPIQSPNNCLSPAATTICYRQPATAVLRLLPPLSGQTLVTFPAKKKKKSLSFFQTQRYTLSLRGMLEYIILYYSMFIAFLIRV